MEFYYDNDLETINLYRLFASLFMQEPAGETLLQFVDIFGIEFPDTSDEIRTDFVYLFSVSEGRFPPYESLYNYPLWDKPRLWGKATDEVKRFYESTGLTLDEEMDLVPDHLSAELLFMSYLIENGFGEHQKNFIEKHLAVWIPEYCDEIKRFARTTFYQQMSALLREFILDECEEFGIEISK